MSKPVGGRGKKAPYETTHVRIPLPIKDRVEQLKEQYIAGSLEYADHLTAEDHRLANEYRNLLTSKSSDANSKDKLLTSLDTALVKAKEVLKQKKSAKESIAKLLTSLYGIEVKPEDLK